MGESIQFRWSRLRGRIPLIRDADAMSMWGRAVMNRSIGEYLSRSGPENLSAIEVSGSWWSDLSWSEYRSTEYPTFDLVDPAASFDRWNRADIVICEQVLEHCTDPLTAARNLVRLARPGGSVIVSTPFLVRIHAAPDDYWRFTPRGLALLMTTAGLEDLVVRSWGNRRCVRSNFRRWTPMRPWRPLRDEINFPFVVWCIGHRPVEDDLAGGFR